jgi:hypothetical protein
MKIIDSKERVFCQCGSRAPQQEAQPASASVGALSLVTLPASYGAQNNGYANFYGHLMA